MLHVCKHSVPYKQGLWDADCLLQSDKMPCTHARVSGRMLTVLALYVQINAAASREEVGQVNGAGQAITALARSFGPFLGGYSWGLSISIGYPGHQFLVFVAISAVAFVSQFLYALVDLPDLET